MPCKSLRRQATKRSTTIATKGEVVILVGGGNDTGLAGNRTATLQMVLQQVEDAIIARIASTPQGVAFAIVRHRSRFILVDSTDLLDDFVVLCEIIGNTIISRISFFQELRGVSDSV